MPASEILLNNSSSPKCIEQSAEQPESTIIAQRHSVGSPFSSLFRYIQQRYSSIAIQNYTFCSQSDIS